HSDSGSHSGSNDGDQREKSRVPNDSNRSVHHCTVQNQDEACRARKIGCERSVKCCGREPGGLQAGESTGLVHELHPSAHST
ncbi:MAG: hypothetical protein ACREXY_12140, partial [Gammaproteobacteria bacterium]